MQLTWDRHPYRVGDVDGLAVFYSWASNQEAVVGRSFDLMPDDVDRMLRDGSFRLARVVEVAAGPTPFLGEFEPFLGKRQLIGLERVLATRPEPSVGAGAVWRRVLATAFGSGTGLRPSAGDATPEGGDPTDHPRHGARRRFPDVRWRTRSSLGV